jgi:hypothetical protein
MGRIMFVRRDGHVTVWSTHGASLSNSNLILSRAEDSTRRGLLLEHLLLMGVGISYLDEMFLATWLGHRRVVELSDYLLTDIPALETEGKRQYS